MKQPICSLFVPVLILALALGCAAPKVPMQQKLTDGSYFLTFPENVFEIKKPENNQKLFLQVSVKEGRVQADPRVQGEAELQSEGTPGWYELGAQKFFPMQTAKAPASPYLEGFLTDSGFIPSARRVL